MENVPWPIISSTKKIFKYFLAITVSVNLLILGAVFSRTDRQDSDLRSTQTSACELPWWDGAMDDCGLVTQTFIDQNNTTRSYCGKRADVLGVAQKVITYCLFGDFNSYAAGLPSILQTVEELYPGWAVRLYTEPENYERELTPLLRRHSNFYVCDVANLPGDIRDLRGGDPRLWRAAVLGDELVDVIFSRDIDAVILNREVSAAKEFLESGKSLHAMRDHPAQRSRIMGGTFGIRQTPRNIRLLNSVRMQLFAANETEHFDQGILRTHLYPKLKNDMMSHDSYSCMIHTGARPFPTQRQDGEYVGNRGYRAFLYNRKDEVRNKCPVQCRPAEHPDWEYC